MLTLGVGMEPLEDFVRIADGVTVTRRINRATRELAADSVVLCQRGRADRRLYQALMGRVVN